MTIKFKFIVNYVMLVISRVNCLHVNCECWIGVKFRNKMSLWLDKHRPTSLSKLDYHKEQALHLKKLVVALLLSLKPDRTTAHMTRTATDERHAWRVSVKCGNVECVMRKVKCGMQSAEWCVECGKLVIKAFSIAYYLLLLAALFFLNDIAYRFGLPQGIWLGPWGHVDLKKPVDDPST